MLPRKTPIDKPGALSLLHQYVSDSDSDDDRPNLANPADTPTEIERADLINVVVREPQQIERRRMNYTTRCSYIVSTILLLSSFYLGTGLFLIQRFGISLPSEVRDIQTRIFNNTLTNEEQLSFCAEIGRTLQQQKEGSITVQTINGQNTIVPSNQVGVTRKVSFSGGTLRREGDKFLFFLPDETQLALPEDPFVLTAFCSRVFFQELRPNITVVNWGPQFVDIPVEDIISAIYNIGDKTIRGRIASDVLYFAYLFQIGLSEIHSTLNPNQLLTRATNIPRELINWINTVSPELGAFLLLCGNRVTGTIIVVISIILLPYMVFFANVLWSIIKLSSSGLEKFYQLVTGPIRVNIRRRLPPDGGQRGGFMIPSENLEEVKLKDLHMKIDAISFEPFNIFLQQRFDYLFNEKLINEIISKTSKKSFLKNLTNMAKSLTDSGSKLFRRSPLTSRISSFGGNKKSKSKTTKKRRTNKRNKNKKQNK